ncbi:MAG: hypothetical protein A3I00_09895 [Betaproteobacteria bacterium RIFCSPLOWO2_02_FULL_64_12]|nr:MAG: hypothetical protein A3I00_09895 [Betaproteobacteria bacterium RIFCSPLOWO2_02_FULL_64_12]
MSVSTSTAELFDAGSQHRALANCLVVSMALHALVLLLFPGFRASSAPADNSIKILVARIAPRVALPEPAPPREAEAVRPPPQPEPPRQQPQPRPEPRPALTRPTPETPRAAPPPAAPAPTPSAPGETASAPSPVPQAPSSAPRSPEPQAPATKGEAAGRAATSPSAEETGSMEQYRLALIGAAKKYKRYPAQAMEKGWQGRVEIRLVIGSNGMTQSVVVKTSSGFQVLDSQALDMVKKAKPLAPIPASLRGREFTVDIPVIFDLQTG